jgi:hypothetical protein
MGRDLDRVDGRARNATGGMGGLGASIGRLAGPAMAATAALGGAAAGAWSLAQAASDVGEAASAAEAVYGDAFAGIDAASRSAATSVGLSRGEYLDAAKTFGVFGQAAGLSGQALGDFGSNLIDTAADMASFHNTSVEDAIAAIGSGLRGEAEPLRRFGILMDDATLKAEAMSAGLITSTKDALTPQQKTLAATALIMGGLGAAQGDFAKTSGEMANQQRILQARLKDVSAELGAKLLPVGLAVVSWLNDMVPKVMAFVDAAGALIGPLFGAQTGMDGVAGAGDKLSGAATILQGVLDLVTVQARFLGGVLSTAVTPIVAGFRKAVDMVRGALEANPRAMAFVQDAAGRLSRALSGVSDVGRIVGSVIGSVVSAGFRAAGAAISTVIGIVDRVIGAFQRARRIVSEAASAIRDAAGPLGRLFGASAGPRLVTAGAAPLTRSALSPARFAQAAAASPLFSLPGAGTGTGGPAIAQTVINVHVEAGIGDPIEIGKAVVDAANRYLTSTGRAQISYVGGR